jgi:hypothetical protein
LNSRDGIKQFFGKFRLPKLTEDETENLHSMLSVRNIEFVITNLHTKNLTDLTEFMGEFCQSYIAPPSNVYPPMCTAENIELKLYFPAFCAVRDGDIIVN